MRKGKTVRKHVEGEDQRDSKTWDETSEQDVDAIPTPDEPAAPSTGFDVEIE